VATETVLLSLGLRHHHHLHRSNSSNAAAWGVPFNRSKDAGTDAGTGVLKSGNIIAQESGEGGQRR